MEGGESHPEEKERGIKDNEEDRETRGVERRGKWRNIYAGSFPSGEGLVGFGNRERLREPPDIVI